MTIRNIKIYSNMANSFRKFGCQFSHLIKLFRQGWSIRIIITTLRELKMIFIHIKIIKICMFRCKALSSNQHYFGLTIKAIILIIS